MKWSEIMRYFLITVCLLITSSIFFAVGTLESHDKQITDLEKQGQVIRGNIGEIQLDIIKLNDKIDILESSLDALTDDQQDNRDKLQNEIIGLRNDLKSLNDKVDQNAITTDGQIQDVNNLIKEMNDKILALEGKQSNDQDNMSADFEKYKKSTNKKITIAYILAIVAIGAAVAMN